MGQNQLERRLRALLGAASCFFAFFPFRSLFISFLFLFFPLPLPPSLSRQTTLLQKNNENMPESLETPIKWLTQEVGGMPFVCLLGQHLLLRYRLFRVHSYFFHTAARFDIHPIFSTYSINHQFWFKHSYLRKIKI